MVDIPAFQDIHFPRQISIIKKFRYISFIINDITLVVAFLAILIWLTNFFDLKTMLFQKLGVYPFTPILFIFSGIPLLFGAKRHLINTHFDAEKEERPWWVFGVPLLFAVIIAGIGFLNFISLTNGGVFSLFHTSSYTGFCFFLIGLALIPPFTAIPHRFHATQLLIFFVSGINVFMVLESIYQMLSPLPVQHVLQFSLPVAFSFIFFCFGVLLRWMNRGFFGNFTLDSTASTFAFRMLMIHLFSAPVVALIVLFIMKNSSYNMYQILAIIVVFFTVTSSLLLWINIKLLYQHELEYLLMRESLRAHNVDLKKEEEALQKSMEQLELDNQQYVKKLNSQQAWQDAADRMG